MAKKTSHPRFLLCIRNDDYPASLEVGKIYRTIADRAAEARHLARVVDESKEDYLYPETYFVAIEIPRSAAKLLVQSL